MCQGMFQVPLQNIRRRLGVYIDLPILPPPLPQTCGGAWQPASLHYPVHCLDPLPSSSRIRVLLVDRGWRALSGEGGAGGTGLVSSPPRTSVSGLAPKKMHSAACRFPEARSKGVNRAIRSHFASRSFAKVSQHPGPLLKFFGAASFILSRLGQLLPLAAAVPKPATRWRGPLGIRRQSLRALGFGFLRLKHSSGFGCRPTSATDRNFLGRMAGTSMCSAIRKRKLCALSDKTRLRILM